jgi:uncharacterized membrane protein
MNSRAYIIARAVQSPVMLITVGVLFALQQAGVIEFWRTWPLLLIVLGILKLLQRAAATPPPVPGQPG